MNPISITISSFTIFTFGDNVYEICSLIDLKYLKNNSFLNWTNTFSFTLFPSYTEYNVSKSVFLPD